MGGKSPKDRSVEAAERQGQLSREAARDATYADRPTQFNPFGSIEWDRQAAIDPATGEATTEWIQTQNLSPDLQQLYNSSISSNIARGNLSAGLMGRIQQEIGEAPDWQQFGDVTGMEYDPTELRGLAEDASYQRETMRLDPQFEQSQQALEIKLRNQGLRPGDEAYDAAQRNFQMGRNDAYERARLGATGTGREESQQLWQQQLQGTELANALRDKQIAEYLAKRQFSLGEAEALDPTSNLSELASIYGGGAA